MLALTIAAAVLTGSAGGERTREIPGRLQAPGEAA